LVVIIAVVQEAKHLGQLGFAQRRAEAIKVSALQVRCAHTHLKPQQL
jgi:hypothetical protein